MSPSSLRGGEVRVIGQLARSSNYTFLAIVMPDGCSTEPFDVPRSLDAGMFEEAPGGSVVVIYKPADGERPLWDFPDGLYRREIAAYLLSEGLGWKLVPETVEREDAPLGKGSLQRFVDADFSVTYFDLVENPSYRDSLVKVAVFDILANSTDRKASHLLRDAEGRIWAIDNGLSFHEAPKLRTVVWDFAGEPIPEALSEGIERVADREAGLIEPLEEYLSEDELEALTQRARLLVETGSLPRVPESARPYPWPLV